jgi:hyperosmotically inducible protein
MKAKFATTVVLAAALAAPLAGYAADSNETSPPKRESAKEFVADSVITSRIKADYAKDREVSAMKIKVDTDKGVVKLSGTAKSQAEADKAVSIAKSIKGVASVVSDIKVGSAADTVGSAMQK